MKAWASVVATLIISVSEPGVSNASELIFLSNQGANPGVRALAEGFSRASGHNVTVLDESGSALEQRLLNGPADLISLGPEAMEALVKKGRVLSDSVTPVYAGRTRHVGSNRRAKARYQHR